MSEFTDLVTDVEKLIRQKSVLLAETTNLEERKKQTLKELEGLDGKLEAIKAEIESDKEKSKAEIKSYSENQSRVISKELKRLEQLSPEIDERLKQAAELENKNSQELNELRGLEVQLSEKEKAIIIRQSDQDLKDKDLKLREEDVSAKLIKLEKYIKELRVLLSQDAELKDDIEKGQHSLKSHQEELMNYEKRLKAEADLAEKAKSDLSKKILQLEIYAQKLEKEKRQLEEYRASLDLRKKNLEDKDAALESEKVEIAMIMARSKSKK